ncbi:MAG TPA: phosphodiesterase [Firmicutes bacterium]|nr:phosphodiesterase [Bacillota bacterium]
MRKVPVWALQPGMKTAKAVYDERGVMLLSGQMEIKANYINNLKMLGIPGVYIEDDIIPDICIEDVIMDETRLKAQTLVRDIFENVQQQPQKPSRIIHTKRVSAVVRGIVGDLLNNQNLVVNLSDIRTSDGYTFAHSVNVAVLAVAVGISLKYPRVKLNKIALGALLHDLGKVKIPLSILNKNGTLSDEEFAQVKKHPVFGYEMISEQGLVETASRLTVYQHHERINGKGYPEGLTGEQIHVAARIAAVADVFDALVADRPYRKAMPTHRALQILQSNKEAYDPEVMEHFMAHIAAYPIGSIVGLSSGKIGVVVHNTAGFPWRPRVRVLAYAGEQPELEFVKPYEVDLVEHEDEVVEKVYDDQNMEKILAALKSRPVV